MIWNEKPKSIFASHVCKIRKVCDKTRILLLNDTEKATLFMARRWIERHLIIDRNADRRRFPFL